MENKIIISSIISYAEHEKEMAKRYASRSKREGNSAEEVAWYHTYLAYSDMLKYIEQIR